MSDTTEPYYLDHGNGHFTATIHTQGAWNPHEQHMAPVSGILAHSLERFQPRDDLRIARISFDILGLIPDGEFDIVTTMLRPGRTIELLQAELISGGRAAVRATAWRLQRSDTSAIVGIEDPPMSGPPESARALVLDMWPGGFIRSIEARALDSHAPGLGRAWVRSLHPLVSSRTFSDVARLIGLADTSNGIASRVEPGTGGYAFPNVDLQVHLYREPIGEWLGLQNSVTFGSDGIGLTSSIMCDLTGPFGRAEQILTLRALGEPTI